MFNTKEKTCQCPKCGASETLEFLGDSLFTFRIIQMGSFEVRRVGKWYQVKGRIGHLCKDKRKRLPT